MIAWCLHWLGQTLGAAAHQAERAQAIGEESLVLAQQTGDAWLIGRALTSLGRSARTADDLARAEGYFRDSLVHSRHVGDRLGVAWALEGLGWAAFEQRTYAAAHRYEEERHTIEADLGNKRGMSDALSRLARIALETGDREHARRLGERSLLLARQAGSTGLIAGSLLGRLQLIWGDVEGATALVEESLANSRESGGRAATVDALIAGGWAAVSLGAHTQAQARLAEALLAARNVGYVAGLCGALEGLAGVAAGRGQLEHAARLFGAAAALRATSGWEAHPSDRTLMDSAVTAVHDALGAAAFATAWSAGHDLDLTTVVAVIQNQEHADDTSD